MRRDVVLILGGADRAESLAARVLVLNYRGLPVSSVEAALRAEASSPKPVHCVILADGHEICDPVREIPKLGAAFRAEAPEFVAVGKRPGHDARDALRAAGVNFALWEPYTDEELRFVINLAHYQGQVGKPRSSQRVPTNMVAQVVGKTGEKPAIVYNLSLHGAYLITPRPTLRGGLVELRITLPWGEAIVDSEVIWNNVPGNLRRSNAPIGMGVRFVDMETEVYDALRRYVKERAAAFSL